MSELHTTNLGKMNRHIKRAKRPHHQYFRNLVSTKRLGISFYFWWIHRIMKCKYQYINRTNHDMMTATREPLKGFSTSEHPISLDSPRDLPETWHVTKYLFPWMLKHSSRHWCKGRKVFWGNKLKHLIFQRSYVDLFSESPRLEISRLVRWRDRLVWWMEGLYFIYSMWSSGFPVS